MAATDAAAPTSPSFRAKGDAPPAGLPAALFDSFSAIRTLARSINCEFAVPEIVFVGKRGAGKSVLIESFFGHKLLDPTPTLRPVEIRVLNNPACETPSVSLLRDAALEQYAQADVHDVPLAKVPEAIRERNTVRSAAPIRVVYQHKYVWDCVVYDTPGLLASRASTPEDAAAAEDADRIALGLAGEPGRLVVSVEEAGDWDLTESVAFVNRVDPRHERSVFVFNKFLPHVKSLSSAAELAAYLRGCPQLPLPSDRVFFTTSPGEGGRPDNPLLYKRRLASLAKTDVDALDALQYDRRFERSIGALALQRCILDFAWKRYQDSVVPRVVRRLRELRRSAIDNRAATEARLAALGPADMRKDASMRASAFFGSVLSMLCGGLEGRPGLNGQTLAEERAAAAELGMAFVPEGTTAAPATVKGADARVYGAQQFERMLSEFREVVTTQVQLTASPDEIATALGASRADVAPDVAWAASDIAQSKVRAAMLPLVERLVERAKFVLRRPIEIAERLSPKADRAEEHAASGDAKASARFPHFSAHIKALYYNYIDELGRQCLHRCTQEFYGTRLVHWELGTNFSALLEKTRDTTIPAAESALALARALFDAIKTRVCTNVLLACYDGMLVQVQSKLMQQLLTKIAELRDAELEELFELSVVKARIDSELAYWDNIITESQAQEADFLRAASSFAHPAASN